MFDSAGARRGVGALLGSLVLCGVASAAPIAPVPMQDGSALSEERIREIVRDEMKQQLDQFERRLEESLSSRVASQPFGGLSGGTWLQAPPPMPGLETLPFLQQAQAAGGWLGVQLSDSDESQGVSIDDVVEGSPAQKAGLRAGDVIVRIGKADVASAADVQREVSSRKAGTRVALTVQRDGEEKKITVELGQRPDSGVAPPGGGGSAEAEVRIQRDKAEQAERYAQEKAEKAEHAAREKAEKSERVAQEKAEKAERVAQEKAEKAERLAEGKAEKAERAAQEKAVKAERAARDKAEKAARAAEAGEAHEGAHVGTPAKGPGFLGVEFESAPDGNGVAITRVVEGSVAEKSGLQAGDVVLSVNGNSVSADAFPAMISELGAGARVKIKYGRDGSENFLVVRLGGRSESGAPEMSVETAQPIEPATPKAAKAPKAKGPKPASSMKGPGGDATTEPKGLASGGEGYLGVETRAIEADVREFLGLDSDQGVLVQRVVEGGPAEGAGLQRNDLILSVGGKNVGTPETLGEVVRAAGAGHSTEVQIIRKGRRETLAVPLGSRTGR